MTKQEILNDLNGVFRDIFDDDSIVVSEQTTAKDVEGWDSLNHINLVVAVEKAFKVKFTVKEINDLANVGDLASLVGRKLG